MPKMPLYYKRFFPGGDINPAYKKLRDKNKITPLAVSARQIE
jgi:hypothetical protein